MRNGERGKEEEQGEEINLFKNYLRVCVFCLRGCPGALCLVLVPAEAKRAIGSPRFGVTDGCKLLCRYWKLNRAPPEERPMLLIPEPQEINL